MRMGSKTNFCFICLSDITQVKVEFNTEKKVKHGGVNKSVKVLLKYLLHKGNPKIHDELLQHILKLSGFHKDGEAMAMGDEVRKPRKCSRLLWLCEKCDGVGDTLLKLHLDLEKLQMIIVNEVKTVRETILRSSGWLGGKGNDNANEMELFEGFSRQFCGGELSSRAKNAFDVLKEFQTAVLETADDSIHVPLVYLQKYRISQVELQSLPPIASPVKTECSIQKYEVTDSFQGDPLLLNDIFDDSLNDDPDYEYPMSTDEEEIVCGDIKTTTLVSSPTSALTTEEVKSEKGRKIVAATSLSKLKRIRNVSKSTTGRTKKVKKGTKRKSPSGTSLKSRAANFKQPIPIVKRISRHYVCDSCSFRCRTVPRFEQHLREHETEEKSFKCDKCSEGFSNKQFYSFHQDLHNGTHRSRCDVCQEFFLIFELGDHLKTHVDTVLPCPYCSQFSSSMERLMAHISKHHFGKDMKCEICEMKFPLKRTLNKHLDEVHKLVEKVTCDFEGCNRTFLNRHSLYLHKNMHTDQFTCKECYKRFTSQNTLDAHQQLHAGIEEKIFKFKCDQCPESFQYRETFQTHLAKKHGGTKFKCEVCGKEFYSAGGLQHHTVMEHKRGKTCPICKTKCLNEYRLGLHMQRHSDVSNFVCEECGKSFKTNAGYKNHIQIHGGRKFQCSYCPKGFTKRTYLVEHIRTHTGEKPYPCDGCGKAFSQKGPFNKHRKNCSLSAAVIAGDESESGSQEVLFHDNLNKTTIFQQ